MFSYWLDTTCGRSHGSLSAWPAPKYVRISEEEHQWWVAANKKRDAQYPFKMYLIGFDPDEYPYIVLPEQDEKYRRMVVGYLNG